MVLGVIASAKTFKHIAGFLQTIEMIKANGVCTHNYKKSVDIEPAANETYFFFTIFASQLCEAIASKCVLCLIRYL